MENKSQVIVAEEPVKSCSLEHYVISCAVVDLRREPVARTNHVAKDSLQETQLLFGEKVIAKEEKGDWLFVEAVEQLCFQGSFWRGYPGWIHKTAVMSVNSFPVNNLFVIEPWSRIYTDPVESSPHLQAVTLGTALQGTKQGSDWWQVQLADGCQGAIPAHHVRKSTEEMDRELLLTIGKKLLHHPYLWGGRSVFRSDWSDPMTGVDCSGLTHLLYRVQGVNIPRDAHDQFLRSTPCPPHELSKGDLIFSALQLERTDHVMLYAGGEVILEAALSPKCVRMITFQERFGRSLHDIVRGDLPPNIHLHFGKV